MEGISRIKTSAGKIVPCREYKTDRLDYNQMVTIRDELVILISEGSGSSWSCNFPNLIGEKLCSHCSIVKFFDEKENDIKRKYKSLLSSKKSKNNSNYKRFFREELNIKDPPEKEEFYRLKAILIPKHSLYEIIDDNGTERVIYSV